MAQQQAYKNRSATKSGVAQNRRIAAQFRPVQLGTSFASGQRVDLRRLQPVPYGLLTGHGVHPVARFVEQIGHALDMPFEVAPVIFLALEPLKFLDKKHLKTGAEPITEIQRDVRVRPGPAAVPPRFGDEANGTHLGHPCFWIEQVAILEVLDFKPIQMDGVKTGVVYLLPSLQKFERRGIFHPCHNQDIGPARLRAPGDIREGDEISLADGLDGHGQPFDEEFCFAHFVAFLPVWFGEKPGANKGTAGAFGHCSCKSLSACGLMLRSG